MQSLETKSLRPRPKSFETEMRPETFETETPKNVSQDMSRDSITVNDLTRHLQALVFLYAFEESVDCHLLSSFCDDSNLHISLFKYVLSTMGVSKESISTFDFT